jgi:hypothetical protein
MPAPVAKETMPTGSPTIWQTDSMTNGPVHEVSDIVENEFGRRGEPAMTRF